MIYLDNAATTFPKPVEVYDYVDWVQRNIAVNTGRGSYETAREADKIVEETRKRMARLLRVADSNDIVITPSATIAANEIIGGLLWDGLKNIYVTPFEHNAIMRPLSKFAKQYGCKIYEIPFDPSTQELDEDEMNRQFCLHSPDYVFINQVSNVTGTIVPIDKISKSAKEYEAIVIVDGSQSVGLIPINLEKLQIDYLIFAGHKNIYASWGVGGFVRNSEYQLKPFITGGTGADSLNLDVDNLEVGSPNIIAIASMKASLEWLEKTGLEAIAEHKKKLTNTLIEGLRELDAEIYVPKNKDIHTSVISLNIKGYTPVEIGEILDGDFDIAVRTGYHCAPFVHRLIGTEKTKGTVRVSVGYFNTEEDIISLLKALKDI